MVKNNFKYNFKLFTRRKLIIIMFKLFCFTGIQDFVIVLSKSGYSVLTFIFFQYFNK